MMDQFEKYIRQRREEFEDHSADRAKMWSKISTELEATSSREMPLWRRFSIRVAAGILLLIGMTVLLSVFLFNPKRTHSQDTQVAHELLEIDRYYGDMVARQVQMVKHNPKLNEGEKQEFLSFLDDLDAEYDGLKQELSRNLDNERVMEAIITNYKKRLELMENLLKQLKERKHEDDAQGYIL